MKKWVMFFWIGLLPILAIAAEVPNGPHVTTTGVGKVEVTPDMAMFSVTLSILSHDASSAKTQIEESVKKYYDFFKQHGVNVKDIDSNNLVINADYSSGSKVLLSYRGSAREAKGYWAQKVIYIKLYNLEKLNSLLDNLGVLLNEVKSPESLVVGNIVLGSSKEAVYRNEARKLAIKNATSRAKELAESFNAKLGGIYSITYKDAQSVPEVAFYDYYRNYKPSTSGVLAYQFGTLAYTDNIQVVFNIRN